MSRADDVDERIEAALRQLPIRTDLADPEQEIAQWVLGLKFAAWAGAGNSLPRARPASRKVTIEELRRLGELCADLAAHIDAMHSPALRLFEGQQGRAPHPLRLEDVLRDTIVAARKACAVAEQQGEKPKNARRDEKTKLAEFEVARCDALSYHSFTGRIPTTQTDPIKKITDGPFVRLVNQLFEIFEFEASAVYQAKVAVKHKWGLNSGQ